MTTLDTAARNRVMAARIVSQNRWPYLSSLLFSLRLVEVPHEQLQTMAVDKGWRMYYSPRFVMENTVEVLATVVLHEAMHCVMQHNERYEALGPRRGYSLLWNLCGDAAINEILDAQDMPWGDFSPIRYDGFPIPGVTSGMITESAYAAAVEWVEQSGQDPNIPPPACGSSSGGEARGYELPSSDDEAPSIDNDRQRNIRDRVASDVVDHARSRGDIPGGLKRWADNYLDPTVDWRKQLSVRLRQVVANVSGRRSHSYARPSRRQDAIREHDPTIIIPGLRDSEPPRIAVVLDTSGSVTQSELGRALAEIHGIIKAVGMREPLAVITCDVEAGAPQMVRNPGALKELVLAGGGGTDLRAGITAALELPRQPSLVVLITDGESPYPEKKPDLSVDFLMLLTNTVSSPDIPDWIHVIKTEG